MKITFLGTGTSQGVPVIGCKCKVCASANLKDKRLRTSIFIEEKGKNIVIDTGPDFRQQMLRENIDKLDAVLFTHEHMDHIAGLDDIRAFNFLSKKPLDVYASERVAAELKRHYYYIFKNSKYPGVPQVNVHVIRNQLFDVHGIDIMPIEVMHFMLPVFGFKINDFVYITDANKINSKEKLKIKNSKILVINALRKEKHISHFALNEALNLIKDLNVEQAYITHVSHELGRYDDITKELPNNVFLAYDGLILNV